MIETLKSLLRVIRRSKIIARMKYSNSNRGRAIVLGNGPSLTNERSLLLQDSDREDFFCVNYFANSELYTELRPKYYVIADPGFWLPSASSKIMESRNLLIENIKSKTEWPLAIFMPFEAREFFTGVFVDQPQIKVCFFNNVPLYGKAQIIRRLYKLGLGCPQAQNVLIAALFLAIQAGYKQIMLYGADHSWHETITLDSMNRVCIKDQHFYDRESRPTPFSIGYGQERTFRMGEIFHAFGKMFDGYWELEAYSKYVGADILNASSVTYIDAFKRIDTTGVLSLGARDAKKNDSLKNLDIATR